MSGRRSATINTGKASDLRTEELVSPEQAEQIWGLPPERLELLNVRDRTILDRELADGQVFQRHEEPVEAIQKFFCRTDCAAFWSNLEDLTR